MVRSRGVSRSSTTPATPPRCNMHSVQFLITNENNAINCNIGQVFIHVYGYGTREEKSRMRTSYDCVIPETGKCCPLPCALLLPAAPRGFSLSHGTVFVAMVTPGLILVMIVDLRVCERYSGGSCSRASWHEGMLGVFLLQSKNSNKTPACAELQLPVTAAARRTK